MKRYEKLAVAALIGLFVLMFLAFLRIQAIHNIVHFQRGYRYYVGDYGIVIDLEDIGRVIKKLDANPDLEGPGITSHPEVGPNVDGYRVYPKLIVGHVSKPRVKEEDYLDDPHGADKPGFFVIDTDSDRVFNGLSKTEWMKRLREFGVNDEPKLFKPSMFDERLKRNTPHPVSD